MKNGWEIKKIESLIIENPKSKFKVRDSLDQGDYIFFTSGFKTKRLNDFLVEGENIFMSTGGRALVSYYSGKASYSTDSYSIKGDSLNLNTKFLYYFILSKINEIDKNMFKGAALKHLQKKDFKNLLIPNPTVHEQKEIVEILDQAFESIEKAKANIEKNIENAKELFQSKLNQIFSQNNYPKQKLSELTNLITKGSSPKWQGIKYIQEPGVLFITSENVGTGRLLMAKKKYLEISFNEKQKRSILKYGDVLSNIVGASIGRTTVFNLNDTANINQAVCLIRCNLSLLNNFYLMHLLNSPILKEIMSENEVDMARANLSLTFFKNLIISVPNIKKQKEIVEKIDILDNHIQSLLSSYEEELKNLEELKKSILQKAFSGELTNKNKAA